MWQVAPKRKGITAFTLIELSIVLVIIGLIVGGVLVGRDLIYTARLRKTGTEMQQLAVAVTTFRAKFDCLSGDCSSATNFFGTNAGCPNPSSGTGTCNGNGDGAINAAWNAGQVEASYAFNQLSLAGLIPGNYPIGPWTTGPHPLFTVGQNMPATVWAPFIGYQLVTINDEMKFYITTVSPIASGSLVITMGAVTNYTDYNAGAGLTAVDAQALDRKMDDGVPRGGLIQATDAFFASAGNSNTACLASGSYSASVTTGCTVYYMLKNQ